MIDFKSKTFCDHIVDSTRFTLNTCPRCKSAGFYYDLSYDKLGLVNTVSNNVKLQQEIIKILSESKRTSGYGFRMFSLLGSLGSSFQKARVQAEVNSALQYLVYLQQQSKQSGGFVSPSEEIVSVSSIEVIQNDIDPRLWHVSISVETRSARNVVVSTVIGSTKFSRGLDTIGTNGSLSY